MNEYVPQWKEMNGGISGWTLAFREYLGPGVK